MITYSLTNFISQVYPLITPQSVSLAYFKSIPSVFFIRKKLKDHNPCLLSLQNGLVTCLTKTKEEVILSKSIKNELLGLIPHFSYLTKDSFFELNIGPLNQVVLCDVFLGFTPTLNYQLETNRKRFNKLLKIARESSQQNLLSQVTFNLPFVQSNQEITDKLKLGQYTDYELFPSEETSNLVIK